MDNNTKIDFGLSELDNLSCDLKNTTLCTICVLPSRPPRVSMLVALMKTGGLR